MAHFGLDVGTNHFKVLDKWHPFCILFFARQLFHRGSEHLPVDGHRRDARVLVLVAVCADRLVVEVLVWINLK